MRYTDDSIDTFYLSLDKLEDIIYLRDESLS